MPEIKVLVMYPRPTDEAEFERRYLQEHVPIAMEKIKGAVKFGAVKVIGTPDGSAPPFFRIAELYFPSMEALQQSVASAGTQEAVAHAFEISTGGPPIVMVCEQETTTF
jgi:uncharacterized protein (TIGR02118 family)